MEERIIVNDIIPIKGNRRTGYTTRLIDAAIQILFNHSIVCIYFDNKKEYIHTIKRLIARFEYEHQAGKTVYNANEEWLAYYPYRLVVKEDSNFAKEEQGMRVTILLQLKR